jgi:dienelactone hydrolase
MAAAAIALFASAVAAASWPECSPTADGHSPHNGTNGTFGPATFHESAWEGKPLYALVPSGQQRFPLVVFMHGSTGQYGMYFTNLRSVCTHGFVVVFPFIRSPEGDKNPLTTNTNGEYILHGISWAVAQNSNASSPLFGKVDLDNVIVAGHSMGATCSIMAGKRLANGEGPAANVTVRLVVSQHPGICGPFGPPPWPSTWLASDLATVTRAYPLLFTTATNDGAVRTAQQNQRPLSASLAALSVADLTRAVLAGAVHGRARARLRAQCQPQRERCARRHCRRVLERRVRGGRRAPAVDGRWARLPVQDGARGAVGAHSLQAVRPARRAARQRVRRHALGHVQWQPRTRRGRASAAPLPAEGRAAAACRRHALRTAALIMPQGVTNTMASSVLRERLWRIRTCTVGPDARGRDAGTHWQSCHQC